MICSKCGGVMPKVMSGNIIDYRHPGVLAKCPSPPVLHADVKKGIMVAR